MGAVLDDALNRLSSASFGVVNGVAQSSYSVTYDAGNRPYQIADSLTGTITLAFDLLDRLSGEATPEGSIEYTYDNANRRQTAQVAGQPLINYSWDADDRLMGISQGSNAVGFTYDNDYRRQTMTLPNGILASYGYDKDSNLLGITYSLGSNNIGNLAYSYDQLGRRLSVSGSLASAIVPQSITGATYDAANELTNWNGTSIGYDANGNITGDGTHSYSWDARNRLASIDYGSTASFMYDPLGRRVSKTVFGNSTSFLYDWANPVQELSGTTPTANMLTGGIDEYFMRTDASGTVNYLTDALGSTSALADTTGTIRTQYAYEPFGATSVSGILSTNSYQYTGRENDGTGLYYYRARYYNPATGRFISEDPLGFGGGDVNLYAYVADSPTNFTDPFGTTITVNGNGANGASYQQAIAYLMRDPGMAAIINDLIRSSTNYNIDFNSNDDDHYDPSTHTVAWDPNSALRTTNNGCQTPALGLGHEMAHADAPWWAPWVGWIPWPAYDNLEERRVITGAETSAAHTLGEGTRTDHSGTPFTVPTPTSTTSPLAGRGCGCGH